jgi:hypothetical protein
MEVLVGENGLPLHEDEETGEYVDEDGNIHEDWDYMFVPVP